MNGIPIRGTNMSKQITMLLNWLVMIAVVAGFTSSVQAQQTDTYVADVPVTITLDGDFADWQGIETIHVTTGPQPAADPNADGSFSFAAAADADNLYVLVDVTDANIISGQHGEAYWNEDSVEVYLNASGDLTLPTYTPAVVQLTVPALNAGRSIDETVIYGLNVQNANARAIVTNTSNGYAIEMMIPLRNNIWTIDPQSGTPLGFQIMLNGATQLDRDIKLSWSSRDAQSDISHLNPSVFGQLVFSVNGDIPPPTEPTAIPPLALPSPQGANFSVEGSTILTPDGQPFVAKGVNVSGYQWVWQRQTVPDADLIVDCWRFNLIRVNSFLFRGQTPYQQYDVNNDYDAIVRAFTERGVVVVFEGHDRIGAYYEGGDLDALVSWYTDLATRYRDNPYVWFDVMNEPGGWQEVNVEKWLRVHQDVIRAIRGAGNDNIIIVEGAHGGQDTGGLHGGRVADSDSAILSLADQILAFDGQSFSNIVFSIHTYDQWNFGDTKLADYFDRVLARNLAMLVGEYGVMTNTDTTAAFNSMFATAIPRNIGRVVWHWDGGDDNDLTINTSQGGGWEIDDCTHPTNLSEMGRRVWDDNHS
jgi:hypothetical protein